MSARLIGPGRRWKGSLVRAAAGVVLLLVAVLSASPVARANACMPTSGQQEGIDVTSFQRTIDYSQVAASGVKFVSARVSDGTGDPDSNFSMNVTGARAAGLAVGAYQFFEPGQDPVAQADLLISKVESAGGSFLPPQVDVEVTGGQTAATIRSNLQIWLGHVQAALGVTPVIYTGAAFWNANVGPYPAAAGFPLWVVSITQSPIVPSDWSGVTPPWSIWQYSFSGSVPGITGAVDRDHLNGGFDGGNLCALAGPVPSPAVPVNTVAPSVSGAAIVGQTLSCSTGTWTNSPTAFSYEWSRDGTPITGAAGTTYAVLDADQGHSLACSVVASTGSSAGSPATSASVSVPAPSAGSPATSPGPSVPAPSAAPANTVAPSVSGAAIAGRALSCSTGTWTNGPTAFSYQWSRDGTPITGATTNTYAVQTGDEGLMLTCGAIASNTAGASRAATSNALPIPVPHVAGCPAATGSLQGQTLGLVKLGMTHARARKAYTHSSDRGKRYEDFFCLTPIGVRVGYPSPALLKTVPRAKRAKLIGRVIWASTSSGYYTLQGVRPGTTLVTAGKLLKLVGPLKVGANTWYLAANHSSTGVLKVRAGLVEEIGIADKPLTTGHAADVAFLHSFT